MQVPVPPAWSPRATSATGTLELAHLQQLAHRLNAKTDSIYPPFLVEIQLALRAQVLGPSPAAQVGHSGCHTFQNLTGYLLFTA